MLGESLPLKCCLELMGEFHGEGAKLRRQAGIYAGLSWTWCGEGPLKMRMANDCELKNLFPKRTSDLDQAEDNISK